MHGNAYILTVVDHMTRYAEAFPLAEATTETVAEALITGVICRHGLFDVMVSDQGAQFVSSVASRIYQQFGIKRRITTPYHPQANGVTERFNGTLKQVLTVWTNEEQDDWDVLLPYALFVYNTSYHTVIQEVPFYVKEGRVPRQPIDIIIGNHAEQYDDAHAYATELVHKLKRVQDRVTEIYQQINQDRTHALEKVNELTVKVGDRVWVHDPTTKKGKSRKLTHRWVGPCVVKQAKSDVVFVIEHEGVTREVNKHRLRAYVPEVSDRSAFLVNEYDTLNEEIQTLKDLQLDLLHKQRDREQQLQLVTAKQAVEENEVPSPSAATTPTLTAASSSVSSSSRSDANTELGEEEDMQLFSLDIATDWWC
jgi:predicted kinase